MKYNELKIFIVILLISLFTLLFVACSGGTDNSQKADASFIEDVISDISTTTCKSKSECGEGKYCNKSSGECLSGECFDDSDCSQGYLCDRSRNYCYFVGCYKDSDCKEGVCKRSTGRCVGCIIDSDCKSGSCDSLSGVCASNNCTDDRLEPNDSFSQAYSINSGMRKLILCPGDDDYFKIPLSVNDELRIVLRTSSSKEVGLYLFSSQDLKKPLSFANIINSGELSLKSAPSSGDYFVRVTSTDVMVNYEIEFIVDSNTLCEDDIFEKNNSEQGARGISDGTYNGLALCPGDVDFYYLDLNKGDIAKIGINGDRIIPEIYTQSENKPMSLQLNKINSVSAQSSGRYFIRVTSHDMSRLEYSMSISVEKENSCQDDEFEENDGFESPKEILPGKEYNLRLCPKDEDWFQLKTSGRPTKITISSQSIIPFEIYSINDKSEPILYSDEYDSGTSIAEFENLPDVVIMRIVGKDTGVDYRLKVEVETPQCEDDMFEPDDSLESPRLLGDGSYKGLKICNGNEDYYGFNLNKGDRISLTVSYNTSEADVDIVLFDPNRKEVAYSLGSTGTEEIEFTAEISGVYALYVFAWDNGTATYQMEARITKAGVSCVDDRFEENDTIYQATEIRSSEIYGLRICAGDRDYYSISLNSGDILSVGVFYEESRGKLYAALLSSDGKTVFATGEKQSGDIVLDITAPSSQGYILLVMGIDQTISNDYDMLIDIKKVVSCTDDRFEENDSFYYAPAVGKGSISNLNLCPSDSDMYRIFSSKGDILYVESTVVGSSTADYSLMIYDPMKNIVDVETNSNTKKSVIAEANSSGYYYIALKNNSKSAYNYNLSIDMDGTGGRTGEERITLYPMEQVDSKNPRLYELNFSRTPADAVVESLYLSLIVEHKSVQDIIITVQYADSQEMTIWNGYGGSTDKGFDDDREDDADIELYNRPITTAKGKSAVGSLMIMIEDYSNTSGNVFAIESVLYWKKN